MLKVLREVDLFLFENVYEVVPEQCSYLVWLIDSGPILHFDGIYIVTSFANNSGQMEKFRISVTHFEP